MTSDVFDALAQEYDTLESMLGSLSDEQWRSPSLCEGWTCSDVVLHLAQTEEGLVSSLGAGEVGESFRDAGARRGLDTVDDVAQQLIDAEAAIPWSARFERWKVARRRAYEGLRAADPERPLTWATNPLKPRTLATTRLSEHWIHANDIAQPLGIDYPDTSRIWHIARLAHRTIPYAYRRSGLGAPPTVRVELRAPDDEDWVFGGEADVVITGTASEFCRIAARRLDPKDAGTIATSGEQGAEVLSVVRTYA
jgi:uncharacterized protein (TIGR03084 family)